MAYKRKGQKQSIEFLGYVDVKLDKKAQGEYKAWRETITDVFTLIDELCENSYRLSCSLDTFNDCFMATLSCTDEKNDNAGYILVGRGSTALTAVLQLLYKERLIGANAWSKFTYTREQDWD